MSWRPLPVLAAVAYALVALAALLLAVVRGGVATTAVAILLCSAPLLLHLAVRVPALSAVALGGVLGAAPFATVPGTGTYAVLALAVWFAVTVLCLRPRSSPQSTAVLGVLTAFLIVSAFSMVVTFDGIGALLTYLRWALAAGITILALVADERMRRTVLRAFVAGAAIGAATALVMVVLDPGGQLLNSLTLFGYGDTSAVGNLRTVTVDGSSLTRVSGLYVDPNVAGLFFLFAFGIAGAQLRGRPRILVLVLLGAAIVGTFSRGAMGALVLGLAVTLVVSHRSAGARAASVAGGILALGSLYWVPALRDRFVDSFDSRTAGVSDRVDALANYPGQMAGHWWFGRGWDLREFTDAAYGYSLNHVANTPLLIVWRAGILSGLLFVALLLVVLVVAVRRSRRAGSGSGSDLALAVYAGTVFFAFQVDFPVVTMTPLTLAFGLLLTQLCSVAPPAPPPADPVAGVRTAAALATPQPSPRQERQP
ncbi:hypothetical protein [Rathayibacter sp. VKM Ac-2927]|uniref:hypothetical protein n=1 Tax=Rathayibacter sp. VKM Ac-2927 TaxID=2929478 RepID=UPI001FB54ECD|nr:hypothetical protein [Rathayibacter sp. VKM Ac-2927]MCJ1688116.1 hypothetical protein [Rathayibacter sp. VKM Ac-2927]